MNTRLIWTTVFVVMLWLPRCGNAETVPVDLNTPQKIYDFAEYLFNKGQYYRAITEYERLLFHFPDHSLAARAKLQIGFCFRKGEQWQQAIRTFKEAAEEYAGTREAETALFEAAETSFAAADYTPALEAYFEFLKQYPQSRLFNKTRYRTGWSYLYEGLPEAASREFAEIAIQGDQGYGKALAAAALQYQDLAKKSSRMAGIFSAVVPGSGQLYANRKRDALVAFLLNSTFILGAIESFNHGSPIVGGILVFFEAGWYAGNLFNAVSDVHKYNQKQTDNFLEELKRAYPEQRFSGLANNSVLIGFTFCF